MASGYSWVPSSSGAGLPFDAVFAGNDSDGDAIYVGRAYHEGDSIPAKVIPNKSVAYIAYNGDEIAKDSFEVLTSSFLTWAPCDGAIPPSAIVGGRTADGETLFIGRSHVEGSLTPGKIHPSHGCLYVPYDGKERSLSSYEVLVAPEEWVPSHTRADIPPNAVFAGHDSDGDAIYVGRAPHEGDMLPAKVIPSKVRAYVAYDGQEIEKNVYDILCCIGYSWVPAFGGEVPPNTIVAGRTSDGEELFVGRGQHMGSLTPGKIHPSHNCLYISYGGHEVSLQSYEALVRTMEF